MTNSQVPQSEPTGDVPSPDDVAAPPPSGEHSDASQAEHRAEERPLEIGGPEGPEPTRYGDWERKGRCIDF